MAASLQRGENPALRFFSFVHCEGVHRSDNVKEEPTLSRNGSGGTSMAKARGDFTDILIKKGILGPDQIAEAKALQQQTGPKIPFLIKMGILGPDQIAEAKALQQQTGAKLQDCLIKLGYASLEDIMSAMADHPGL